MSLMLKKIGVYAVCFCFVLTGCVTNQGTGTGTASGPNVGPQLSSLFDKTGEALSIRPSRNSM